MSYTLVVIDMQWSFNIINKKLVNNVVKHVVQARKERRGIVLVRYYGCGSVCEEILEAVDGYKKIARITKNEVDGSLYISKAIRGVNLFSKKHFKICGVYTGVCVYATVAGMTASFPLSKITVLANATSDFGNLHKNYLKKIKRLEKVEVV